MTLLYTDPRFLNHDTGKHPERAERLLQTVRHLDRVGLIERLTVPTWEPASIESLTAVHTREYLDKAAKFARDGGGRIEADTVVSRDSFEVTRLAAGAAVDAVRQVTNGYQRNAFCLLRPPGHHALADRAMGFCLVNNIAVAAREALQLDYKRILIVDWDVHHGNGTQDLFYDEPRVAFFSSHRHPFYPGTGMRDETGTGAALGTKRNLPLRIDTDRKILVRNIVEDLTDFADRMKPELVLLSAGFDAHRDDPVGSLGLESEDFIPLTRVVLDIARQWSDGRCVSLLEGGYNPGIMAGCVELHLRELSADHGSC